MSEDMNAPPNGWPVGTVCVITHYPSCPELVGEMVRVLSKAEMAMLHETAGASGKLNQLVEPVVPRTDNARSGWHPVAWMRPLEDPDAETIETEDEVTA